MAPNGHPLHRPASAARTPSLWQTIRQSLAGQDHDYTREPIGRAVLLLAIPMALEMLMEAIFAVVDIFYVTRLGTDAVAAVGLTEGLATLIYAVAGGVSVGATALVSRQIGAGHTSAANRAAGQVVFVGLVISAAFAVIGGLGGRASLELMGGSPELVDGGASYAIILFAGSPTIVLLFLNNAILRGAGDATRAMRALWLANGVNIVLDPLLIFGWGPFPELGLAGAAVATTIGRGLGVAYQLAVLTGASTRVRLLLANLRPRRELLARLARVSAGGVAQSLIGHSSWVVLVRFMSEFGSEAVAGYTIAIRIVIFALLPAWGVANAAATLVGQNLGAGLPDRAAAATWRTGWINAGVMSAVALVFIAIPDVLVGLFSPRPEEVEIGAACLRVLAYGYGLLALGMVMVQAFNGAGDTLTPTVINLFAYWLFQLPLAWLLAFQLDLGPDGVFWAITAAESSLAVVGFLIFRRGRWKSRVV